MLFVVLCAVCIIHLMLIIHYLKRTILCSQTNLIVLITFLHFFGRRKPRSGTVFEKRGYTLSIKTLIKWMNQSYSSYKYIMSHLSELTCPCPSLVPDI